MAYKIDKGIPLAKHGNAGKQRPGNTKYPFRDMSVGDSFVATENSTKVASAACQFVKRGGAGREFATRKLPDGKTRCWRIT